MDKDIRVGDKVFYRRCVQQGSFPLQFWAVVTITKLTASSVFVGDVRFNREYCFGVDLYEITDESKQEAKRDHCIVQHFRLCVGFRHYKWHEVSIDKLLRIEAILSSTEE